MVEPPVMVFGPKRLSSHASPMTTASTAASAATVCSRLPAAVGAAAICTGGTAAGSVPAAVAGAGAPGNAGSTGTVAGSPACTGATVRLVGAVTTGAGAAAGVFVCAETTKLLVSKKPASSRGVTTRGAGEGARLIYSVF